MTSSEIRETPCFTDDESKERKVVKRARLDESTTFNVVLDLTENHDDDGVPDISAATKRMMAAMGAFTKKTPPQEMFAIYVKSELNDGTGAAYAAPRECESAKKIRTLLTRCFENRPTNNSYGPFEYQLASTVGFLLDNPDANDDNFLIDFANVLEDESQQDEKTLSGSASVDADLVNVKKIIGDELSLWLQLPEEELSSLEENPKYTFQFCMVDGYY